MISVALACYNGEKYIKKQLESIYRQTKKVDEVIICDDGSTDKTEIIINKFIKKYNLGKTWFFFKNKKNKGFATNFVDCSMMTKGDIIFFSDQDDIWMDDKIEIMTQQMELEANIQVLACGFMCIDCNDVLISPFFSKVYSREGGLEKITFSKQIHDLNYLGMSLAVRRNIIVKSASIVKKYKISHDLLMAALASTVNGLYILHIPLVKYRQHLNTISNHSFTFKQKINNIDKRIHSINIQLHLYLCFFEIFKNKIDKNDKKDLKNIIKFMKNRFKNVTNRRLIESIISLLNFNPMINKKWILADIYCIVFGNYTNINK